MDTGHFVDNKLEQSVFSLISHDIKKNKRKYYTVIGVTFILAVMISFSMPNYYQCTVKLAPEISGTRSGGSLSGLASSFGLNLGSTNSNGDAIMPVLYPDLMNSVTFKVSLFPVKVQLEDEDSSVTYYDYLLVHQKTPWWTSAVKSLASLFSERKESKKVNPFRLTNEQAEIIDVINKKVICDVDDKTMVITIDVTDQNPLIAATMADSVQMRLQEFITEYRTRKARIDLAYNQKLIKEAKTRYEQARKRYSSFTDAHQRAFMESVLSQKVALENDMQLQYQAYTQVASQLMAAEAKVQQDTPAFTMLQPATVPVKKSGPNRKATVFAYILLAFIATTVYVVYREGHVKTILAALRKNSSKEMFDDDELYYLSKLLSGPGHEQSKK